MRIWEEALYVIKVLSWQMAGVSEIVETSVWIAGVPSNSNLAPQSTSQERYRYTDLPDASFYELGNDFEFRKRRVLFLLSLCYKEVTFTSCACACPLLT